MHDNSKMHDNSIMRNNSEMRDSAELHGKAELRGNAKLSQRMIVGRNNTVVVSDLSKDLCENIRCQTGLLPINGKVIAYKQVRKDMTSFHDGDFKYEVGKVVEAENIEESNKSCTGGLHFSNANCWNKEEDVLESIFLMAEIQLEDIITVQEGKIRCRKAKILGSYEIDKQYT